MNRYLLLIMLAVISPIINAASSECEVMIRSSIPKSLNLAQLKLDLYSNRVPINSHDFEICTTYEELSVSRRHFSRSKIGIIGEYKDGITYLLQAALHRQSKTVYLNTLSTVAVQACPNQCGYYEYEKLVNDKEVQRLGEKYKANLAELADGDAIGTKISDARRLVGKQAKQRYAQLSPSIPQLPRFKKGDGYLSSPYSGTYNFFPEEPSRSEVFESIFESRVDAFFQKVDKKQFRKKSKQLKSLAREMYKSLYEWDKFLIKSNDFATALRETNEPMLIEYADMIDQTIKEAEDQHHNTITRLRSLSGTPFESLTQRDIEFGELMGLWSYIAYHQAELNEKEAFATLFSQHYLQEIAPELLQDKNADKSVSYLVAMFNLLWEGSDEQHMQQIKGEFDNTATIRNNRYSLKDSFLDLSFVYENGAWRLDYVQMANL